MKKVLIAYNDDSGVVLHDFFESCADEAKQICYDHEVEYTSICPPNLNEQSVCGAMSDHLICVIAGHGDTNGIYNETSDPVVSIRTVNYNFTGKGFYSVACSCAQNLYPHLKAVGVLLFVGYRDVIRVRGKLDPFVRCAMAGLRSFLAGDKASIAKDKMLSTYDEQISSLDSESWERKFLVHNKEALVFEYENDTYLDDLE